MAGTINRPTAIRWTSSAAKVFRPGCRRRPVRGRALGRESRRYVPSRVLGGLEHLDIQAEADQGSFHADRETTGAESVSRDHPVPAASPPDREHESVPALGEDAEEDAAPRHRAAIRLRASVTVNWEVASLVARERLCADLM